MSSYTLDEQLLFTYNNMYNNTIRQIDLLYTQLSEIQQNINLINNRTNNRNRNRTNNRNRNSQNNWYTNPDRNNNETFRTRPSSQNTRDYVSNRYYSNLLSFQNNNTLSRRFSNLNNNNLGSINTLLDDFLSPIVVRPTRHEILNATRDIQYDAIQNPLNNSCPISLERFNSTDIVTQIRHCGHIFNTSDVIHWFDSNVRCPVCRYDIRRYSQNTRTERRDENENQTNIADENSNVNNENISQNDISNNYIEEITSSLSELISSSFHNESRYLYDPSNNIFIFETILRPIP